MGPALQQEGAHQPDQMALQLQVLPILVHSCNQIGSYWLMPLLEMAGKVFMSQAAFLAHGRRGCLTLPSSMAGEQQALLLLRS